MTAYCGICTYFVESSFLKDSKTTLALVSVVLLGRGLCNGLITRPEESYRV